MAVLTVIDDDGEDGEAIRVRSDRFVIGRLEGDLVIPHDSGMSGRHAEITRRPEKGELRWFLRDLGSTNGTFVRAATVLLRHGQELLIGNRRFRFEKRDGARESASPPPVVATQKWQGLTPDVTVKGAASLVELRPDQSERRFPLSDAENTIGRDRGCTIVVDDPMVNPRHARIARDPQGRWMIANNASRNGIWARAEEVPLGRGGQFQCGEQRFLIRIL
jgi:pSer/pThr/pTyr-binding forkhead associated (FHA) protein